MKILVVILMVTVPTVLAAKAKPDWQKAVVMDQLDKLGSGGADDLPRMFGIPAVQGEERFTGRSRRRSARFGVA